MLIDTSSDPVASVRVSRNVACWESAAVQSWNPNRASDSFAIYFEHINVSAMPKHRQLRGKPATHARLAGPPPLMTPRSQMSTSLYSLQEKARAEAMSSRQPAVAAEAM